MTPTQRLALQDLRAARALISKPRNWCKGTLHRRAWFRTQRCMVGACYAATDGFSPRFRVISALLDVETPGDERGALFNDKSTHSQVMAVFDRAIKRLEKVA